MSGYETEVDGRYAVQERLDSLEPAIEDAAWSYYMEAQIDERYRVAAAPLGRLDYDSGAMTLEAEMGEVSV